MSGAPGGGGYIPSRWTISGRFTPAAFTWIKISPAFGSGSGSRAGFSADCDVLDEATAARLSRPDPKTELVLVGAEPFPPGEAMIAGLARARIVPGTREAEYAILLGSYVAGLGLGRHLMQKLVKWSRGRYLDRLYGDTPGSNEPMLELAASMGFRPSNERGVPAGLTRLVLDL